VKRRDRRVARQEKRLLRCIDELLHHMRLTKVGHLEHGYTALGMDDQRKIDALESERDALIRRINGGEVIAFDSGSRLKSA
jgi:hypothetical protein